METNLIYYTGLPSPFGTLWAAISEGGLWAVQYGVPETDFLKTVALRGAAQATHDSHQAGPAAAQVVEYLHGERRTFDLAIDWRGMTEFQKDVRMAVMAVPYGQTASYGDIARQVCTLRAARAVGRVNATNPLPLVIPCHRIIGSDGRLTGYGGVGGTRAKARLLALEGTPGYTSE